ncbi:UPF0758 domain-containing protein [Mucilaginibacter pedocola]|uniref:UPF0758 domain-containing protein n=1 Tax=Mucilaginibacter pedocola TaxID=1792845 RepID=A0A1S9PBI8_9SPHI|nr:UPF0758 domain-containing protein [Mucilaginibacter pedocola]OOQ58289.1 hypothetical protein BC343_11690 [Mucilaginibacter pedocola]
MEAVQTNYPNLASETFNHGRKHYFIDIKRAVNNKHFLLITSSEQYQNEQRYDRQTVMVWEEDLAVFVEAFSMVLSKLAYGQLELPPARMEVLKDEEPKGMMAIPEYDRPREKLHALGAGSLSNAELLAILLGTGSSELSVLDLCGRIMQSVGDEPSRLPLRTAEDYCRFPGVGVAKAATLMAALELGRRAYLPAKH